MNYYCSGGCQDFAFNVSPHSSLLKTNELRILISSPSQTIVPCIVFVCKTNSDIKIPKCRKAVHALDPYAEINQEVFEVDQQARTSQCLQELFCYPKHKQSFP